MVSELGLKFKTIKPFYQADLVVVHSEELNNFISNITNGEHAWLGGIRVGPRAFENQDWVWIDGTTMYYSNWHHTEPRNYFNGSEFCLHTNFVSEGKWNDIQCSEVGTGGRFIVDSYVCETIIK